jgi:hypothetical protein
MELVLVKKMMPTHESVADFEAGLQARVGRVDGYLDGWGVLQREKKPSVASDDT